MVKLRAEDVSRPEDIVDFNDDNVSSMSEALRKPGGLVSSSDSAKTSPSLMSDPRSHIGSKALTHLEATINVIKSYNIVNLKPLAIILRHDAMVKRFKLEFDAIKEHK